MEFTQPCFKVLMFKLSGNVRNAGQVRQHLCRRKQISLEILEQISHGQQFYFGLLRWSNVVYFNQSNLGLSLVIEGRIFIARPNCALEMQLLLKVEIKIK